MKLQQGRPATNEGRLEKEIRTYDLLDKVGVEYWHIDHEAAFTMETCEKIDKVLNTTMCKNLFLCNRQKTNFYLLLMPGNKPFKTKELSHQIGSSRLSFADAEDMKKYLDITPGSVSIMGLMNDKENAVKLLVDEDVLADEYLGCHPCVNTASLKIKTADVFEPVLEAMHHDMTVVKLPYDTISYYNENAQRFVQDTINVEFSKNQTIFLSKLASNAQILDFGCGSGRDTKYFLKQGYQVNAIDGSKELCRLASEYTGISVRQMLFQELDEKEVYDGIWACSSILHLPVTELVVVLQKMADALKNNGVIYTSFKYGTYEGVRNGRYFTDMTEDKFSDMLKNVTRLEMEEQWITSDVRPGRGEEQWLNLILRKI